MSRFLLSNFDQTFLLFWTGMETSSLGDLSPILVQDHEGVDPVGLEDLVHLGDIAKERKGKY